MDLDFELILYIIFVLVAIFSRFLKKKAPQSNQPGESEPEPKQPAMSFEDLLKEFQGRAKEKPRQERTPSPEPATDYDFKDSIPDDDEIQEVYERSIQQAEDSPELGSLSKRPKFEHFEPFDKVEEENELATEIRQMLKSPENAAKAIILSEIINRKY